MRKQAIILTLLTLPVTLQPAAAGPGQAGSSESGRSVQRLRPDVGSDPGLGAVEVILLPDGGRRLSITYHSDRRLDVFMYYVVADPQNSAYRAFRITTHPLTDPRVIAYLRTRRPELEARGQWDRFQQLLDAKPATDIDELWRATIRSAAEEPPPICTYCQNTCNGSGFSRAITLDPPGIELTHTNISLNWSKVDTPSGCAWRASGSGWCWAASPTIALTNWYVDQCPRRWVEGSENYAYGSQNGTFWNIDFGSSGLGTTVRNKATMTWYGGQTFGHGYEFSASGEFWFLLDAVVLGSHFSNCP